MDQDVVNQLSLDSLLHFEDQLKEALRVIVELHDKLEVPDFVSEEDCTNENLVEDIEADFQETVSQIQNQHYQEIQDLDEVRQKQQEDFQNLFQQLKELERMTNELKQWNKSDDQYIKNATFQIQEKQNLLKELSQEFLMQDIINKEKERIIQNLQSQLTIVEENDSIDGSKNKTNGSSQITQHRRQESEESVDHIQYLELTNYKQKLQEELDHIVKQKKMTKQKFDAETQTNLHDFPIRPKSYDEFGFSNSFLQPTFSIEHTPQTSQILLHSQLKEETQQKNRECCAKCQIF